MESFLECQNQSDMEKLEYYLFYSFDTIDNESVESVPSDKESSGAQQSYFEYNKHKNNINLLKNVYLYVKFVPKIWVNTKSSEINVLHEFVPKFFNFLIHRNRIRPC